MMKNYTCTLFLRVIQVMKPVTRIMNKTGQRIKIKPMLVVEVCSRVVQSTGVKEELFNDWFPSKLSEKRLWFFCG